VKRANGASRTTRLVAAIAGSLALALTVSGCVASDEVDTPESLSGSTGEVSPWLSAASTSAVSLPSLAGPYPGTPNVAEGLLPPTNSWLSGGVLPTPVQPLFTGVLAVLPGDDGFTVGLPRPVATDKTVFGSFPPDVSFSLESDSFTLAAYDSLSGTFAFSEGDNETGRLTLAQGWPYSFYTATAAQIVGLPAANESNETGGVITVGGVAYEFISSGGVEASTAGTSVELEAGDTIALFAHPAGASDADLELLRSGAVALKGTGTSYVTADGLATTALSYDVGGAATVFASRVHQEIQGASVVKLAAGYESIYGALTLHSGSEFHFSVPEKTVTAVLDVSGLTADEKASLATQVTEDAATIDFAATDTYYGGKALYRASQLYGLATGLGLTDVTSELKTRMLGELELWLDPAGCMGRSTKCFVYDPVLRGITGLAPSYGSDEFNDHHFHYGYFLYALSVLAADDASLVDEFRTMADVIAADIAAPQQSENFMQRRSFDDYTGHSWASGTSPFADGNNQESASESVNAWVGLLLWAQVSENEELVSQATWLYSTESATATRYWLGADLPSGFTSPFFALNWAGKRDYATFFDATPSAILGVELLPMSPSTSFLPADADLVHKQVDDAIPTSSLELPLVDYVIMYLATVDRDAALELESRLPDSRVDNANTRSYLQAWILTRPTP
jgi:endo-1,3(4)-beta-glucanase